MTDTSLGIRVKFKHLRSYIIECEEKHCGDCARRDGALCRIFPRYQRKGYREMYVLKWDGMRTLRIPECLKYGEVIQ